MPLKKPGIFVRGIPIKSRYKGIIVGLSLLLLFLNIILPQYIDALNYPASEFVSLGLIIVAVVFSIGSYATETVIIALTIFVIISASYDFGVKDFSSLRRNILIGGPIILLIETIFGKIGIIHLIKTLKNQFGIK